MNVLVASHYDTKGRMVMSLMRFRKKDTSDHAEPAPAKTVAKKTASEPRKNIFQRIRDYLVDSYNGLYKIFLSGYVPKTSTFVLVITGIIIGLVWGYGLNPTQYYDAAPSSLRQSAQDQWIKMVAGSHFSNFYTDEDVVRLLQQVENPAGNITRLLESSPPNTTERVALQNIQPLAIQAGAGTPAPKPEGFLADLIKGWILPIIIVVIAMPLLNLAWKVLLYQYVAFPIIDFIKMRTDENYRQDKARRRAELEAARQRRQLQEQMVVEKDEALGAPIIQKLSIYTKGRNYDDSFEIEDDADTFLGECGASIAAKDDSGEPVAIEVWMFEMASQNTLSKIFITPAAANDPAVRSKLEPRVENPATDIIVAQNGSTLRINADTLILQAKILETAYSPAGNAFETFQMQIATFSKGAGGAPSAFAPPAATMPTPAMPPQPAPTFAPPPAPVNPEPSGGLRPLAPPPASPSPVGGGLRPLAPPPLQPLQPPPRPVQPPEDDDPFGGSGDFTPLGNS